jgi:cytochrome c oxidase subunit III
VPSSWEWSHFIHGGGGYITAPDGAKYWVHNDTHDTHDPANAPGFHLVPAKEGHYLIAAEGAEHLDHDASLKLWNERVNYVDGANMTRNEYGPPQYANFFFFITGFHGFHVFSGVVINLIVLIMAIQGVFHRRGHYEMIEKAGLYWHFVDLVWVFVFTFFYLL